MTDEVHQLFVPGRSGQISDIILDSAGALAGVLVLAAAGKLIKRKQNFKETADVHK